MCPWQYGELVRRYRRGNAQRWQTGTGRIYIYIYILESMLVSKKACLLGLPPDVASQPPKQVACITSTSVRRGKSSGPVLGKESKDGYTLTHGGKGFTCLRTEVSGPSNAREVEGERSCSIAEAFVGSYQSTSRPCAIAPRLPDCYTSGYSSCTPAIMKMSNHVSTPRYVPIMRAQSRFLPRLELSHRSASWCPHRSIQRVST